MAFFFLSGGVFGQRLLLGHGPRSINGDAFGVVVFLRTYI